ncbi:hypothetical protein [Paraburkholderia kururiensis]|uniref:hypothetical protein n=1 Tax=Paraburkholderia kururiensis TaxID=984307 RepID=UPI000E0BCF44
MLLRKLLHLAASFIGPVTPTTSPSGSLDSTWHGDHWQNLLSAPMDARHYVMEDWSVVAAFQPEPTGGLPRQ